MLALLASACGDKPFQDSWTHEFPAVELAAGEEREGICQSWTLGNDEPLYIDAVELSAGQGWHHSNWLYVTDDVYDGPDGVWPCEERDFDEVEAAIRGGVLTAQATQAQHGEQQFAAGHALVLPAHARIIGNTHGLNAADTGIATQVGLRLHAIPAEQVKKRLHGLSFVNHALALEPHARSRFSTRCELAGQHEDVVGRPVDFKIYYVLPHYHALGEGMTIAAVGGPHDGQVVFNSQAHVGEPSGQALDPPYDMTGATGLQMSCDYSNPRDQVVGWGIGDQEMCVMLAFTDAEVNIGGGVLDADANQDVRTDAEGVFLHDAPCQSLLFLPRDE
jgi:hypothetical protein